MQMSTAMMKKCSVMMTIIQSRKVRKPRSERKRITLMLV